MEYGLIQSAVAPVMKEASLQGSLDDEVLYGMKVELLQQVNEEWYRIRTHYRYEGMVEARNILTGNEAIQQWEQGTRLVVRKTYADILSEPRVQGIHVISLSRGAQVKFLEKSNDNGWVKVGLVDGRSGYIKEGFLGTYSESMYEDVYQMSGQKDMKEYINSTLHKSEEEFRKELVTNAKSYLGTQYRWGGKGSLGIDCSGLCSISYMLAGVVIYRDAAIKEEFPVHEIPFDEKKPGDLLYFPGHIAMYLGDGRYIHSTAKNGSDGVVINSLNPEDEDYREDLLQKITATGSIF